MKKLIDELRMAGITRTDLTISGHQAGLLTELLDAVRIMKHRPEALSKLIEQLKSEVMQ